MLITIEVTGVRFQRRGNPWAVIQAQLDGDQSDPGNIPDWLRGRRFAVVGELGAVQPGDLLDVEGEVAIDPRYGQQIKATRAEVAARRDERALETFLRRLPHIGAVRVGLLIQHFGDADEVFRVLEDAPERLAEINGITPERAASIARTFAGQEGARDAWALCRDLNLNPRLAAKIIDRLGGDARRFITTDPFLLMSKLRWSFRDCDMIRRALGIAEDDPRRIAAGALYVMQASTRNGDCWSERRHLLGGGVSRMVHDAREQVSMSDALIEAGLSILQQPVEVARNLVEPPRIIEDDDHRLYVSDIYSAEISVCDRLLGMLAA